MLAPLVLGDLTDELARRRTRNGEGPSIAWTVGHILDYRCQLITLFGTPETQPVPARLRHLERNRRGPTTRRWSNFCSTGNRPKPISMRRLRGRVRQRSAARWAGNGPHGGRSVLDAVAFAVFHEAYHLGALGAIRKSLGLPGPAELVMAQSDRTP